jgi:DNA-binding MarR family transcriptional regulator
MRDQQIDNVLIAIRRVTRAIDLHSRDLVRTTGLTAPQLLLLQSIKARGDVTVGELARDVSLSQATVTSILDRLEDRAYVVRKKSTVDKRKVHTRLTKKGSAAVKDAPVPLQESFVRQFDLLQNWEQNMIIASLQRVAQMMDAQHLDASPVLDVGVLDRKEQGPPDK